MNIQQIFRTNIPLIFTVRTDDEWTYYPWGTIYKTSRITTCLTREESFRVRAVYRDPVCRFDPTISIDCINYACYLEYFQGEGIELIVIQVENNYDDLESAAVALFDRMQSSEREDILQLVPIFFTGDFSRKAIDILKKQEDKI